MKAKATVDPGICGFKAVIKAECNDGMTAAVNIVSSCETMQQVNQQISQVGPINVVMELNPNTESAVLKIAGEVLVKKGCCEACIVPAAAVKATQVAAGLALPKDVTIQISKS